jgi:hypothetical protein
MGQTLNLKSGSKLLASIRVVHKHSNKPLVPILHENTVGFTGDQNGEMHFELINYTEFDLTIDILNTNRDKINKIDLLRPYQSIIIERNEVLGSAMIMEEYITDKGKPIMFRDERSRCLGEIIIGFDRVYSATSSWDIDYCWVPITNGGFARTETDGVKRCYDAPDGGSSIYDSSRALLRTGRALEQVKFRETTTTEKFHAYIKFDFGMYAV